MSHIAENSSSNGFVMSEDDLLAILQVRVLQFLMNSVLKLTRITSLSHFETRLARVEPVMDSVQLATEPPP